MPEPSSGTGPRPNAWPARRLLAGGCGALVLALPGLVHAASPATASFPAISIGVGPAQSGSQVSSGVEILLALTVLSLAPAVLLLMTSFTRIVVVLSFARNALGSGQLPPNQVLIGLALFLTLFVMSPTISAIYTNAWQPFQQGTIDLPTALQRGEDPLRAFMLKQTRPADLNLFLGLQKQRAGVPAGTAAAAGSGLASGASSTTGANGAAAAGSGTPASGGPASPSASATSATGAGTSGAATAAEQTVPLQVLVPAFVISELRIAFEMGFVLFVPFVIIDLVVASTLMAMGMVMLPPMLISLPFKILLFVLVDGWSLLAQSLVQSFH